MRLHVYAGLILLALAPGAVLSGDISSRMSPENSVTPFSRLVAVQRDVVEVEPFYAFESISSRSELLRQVLARNPSLEAAHEAWTAAQEQVPQVVALPDPDVFYSISPLSIGASDVRFGQTLGISQRLPFPGTLRRRGDLARAETAIAHHDYDTLRLELATFASQLYDDYAFLFRALEINAEHIELVEQFKQVATSRYAAGLAPQQDPIQAEVELAHLEHRALILRSARATVCARLNALLHRTPEAALQRPAIRIVPDELNLDSAALQQQGIETRPQLQARSAQIEAAEATVELRRLAGNPDFRATTSYNSMWAESDYRWSVGVSLNLPIQRRRIRAGIAQAEARRREAERLRESLEDTVRSEIQQACERLREAHQVVHLYESRLLPASRDQVQAALAGFKTSRNSFLALIDAERNLRTVEIEHEGAVTDFHRRSAALDRAVGRFPTGVSYDRLKSPALSMIPTDRGDIP